MPPTTSPRHSSSIRTPSSSATACGEQALSPLQWVWGNAFCIEADIDYSHLTWAMLDPVNGTSERVLNHPKSTGAIGRDPFRKALGRLWPSPEYAGRNNPILRLAKRKAPRLYAIASKAYRGLRRDSSAEPQPSPSLQLLPSDSVRSSYDAISKLNIIDNVAKVTCAFYERLGLSPQQSPVYRCLASMRAELTEEVEARGAVCHRVLARTLRVGMARLRGRQTP